MTPIDRLLAGVASVRGCVFASKAPFYKSPLIPSAGVCSLHTCKTGANRQLAAQGRRGDAADEG